MLIDNNDNLIFTMPLTDPYVNVTSGGGLLQQNQDALDLLIGANNYDIGHVFTTACTDVGGVVSGRVCNDQNKGRGVTCIGGSILGAVSRIMTHEVGHQFSAGHTWNRCDPSAGQYAGGSAFEPGSGSTIMSYAGACGPDNIGADDTYFHIGSIQQIYNWSHIFGGAECASAVIEANNTPDLELPYEDGFFIPHSTPFELTAIADDCDGDNFSYCWEQYDLGPSVPLGTASGSSPLFRSFLPNDNPTRIFPRINAIVANTIPDTELLPDYGRPMTFRCTVRDNVEGAGGVVWEEVAFRTAAGSGPFRVLQPSLEPVDWKSGQFVEITWDVASSNVAPVNCERVDILLSTNGGFEYPDTLAVAALNDGSQFISLPNIVTNAARVKIKGHDNIFFDISNQNFSIQEPTEPGFGVNMDAPLSQRICLPESIEIDIETFSLLGYDSLLTLSVNNLPPNAIANFSSPTVQAGDQVTLSIDMEDVVVTGDYTVEVIFEGPGQDPEVRTIDLSVVFNDFSDLVLSSPQNSLNGTSLLPDFSWEPSVNADSYILQVATSPSFDASSLVYEEEGITDVTATPPTLFEISTLYYWRVIPVNRCGTGDASAVFAFHTENLSCNSFVSDETPVFYSSDPGSVRDVEILVDLDIPVSDVNVRNINGSYDPMDAIRCELIAPDGETSVTLFEDKCLTAVTFNMGLDDAAPTDIQCPPVNGTFYRPENTLEEFIGTNAFGNWILRTTVIGNDGTGGGLTNIEIEICSNVSASAPFLVTNDALPVPPGEFNYVSRDYLLTEDDNNSTDQIEYTLVSLPAHGELLFQGQPLVIGDNFRQATIDALNLTYQHDGSNTTDDFFLFTVNDGEGGFFGVDRFNIVIDENATVNTEDLELANPVTLFPNPAQNLVTIEFERPVQGSLLIDLVDVRGSVIQQQQHNQVGNRMMLNTNDLPSGIYFVRLTTEAGTTTKRLSILR